MEKIAVFVNEVAHARHILQPMVNGQGMTHWVLIACPPKLTRHIGRWLSRSAQDQWKERWSLELFAGLEPLLKARTGNKVEKLLAKRPLVDMSKRLEARLGGVSFLDARCPTLYKQHEPLTSGQPSADNNQWTYPLAVTTGLSAMLALAD
jgi:hypothetical protein